MANAVHWCYQRSTQTGFPHPPQLPTDCNTWTMTPSCVTDLLGASPLHPPHNQESHFLSAVHGSAFSGHKLEVTVHTELRLFRKCFFRKNVG